MRGIGYIALDEVDRPDGHTMLMLKDDVRIGYVTRDDMLNARKGCGDDLGTFNDPAIFQYFREIKLHPSQYTIERISA